MPHTILRPATCDLRLCGRAKSGYERVKFFFLLTFAAAIPAIVSGGIAERARFGPQLIATVVLVGLIYPLFEGVAWNRKFGIQHWIKATTGAEFHDFAGSVVVPAVGGWIGRTAVLLLGARAGRYRKDGAGLDSHGVLCISRCPHQRPRNSIVPISRHQPVAAHAAPAQSKGRDDFGSNGPYRQRLAAQASNPSSLAE